jgi:hypothetical protein
MIDIKDFLNIKFSKHSENKWYINEWINYGATFGLILELSNKKWNLITYEESGYYPSSIIFEDLEIKKVLNLIENISPTNENYKTD